MKKTYFAWIPTNSGYLNIHHILTPKWNKTDTNHVFRLIDQELYVTDSTLEKSLREQIIYKITCEIDFSNILEWKFKININDGDKDIIEASGNIEQNGKTKFSYNTVNENLLTGDIDNIPNTIFTFLKQQIHRDLHHLEKVDNVIPICTSIEDWKIQTANGLVKKIKSLEFDAKRIYRDGLSWDKFKTIEAIYWDAKGFQAYFEAFINNCVDKNNNNYPDKYLNPLSIIDSLAALQGKINASRQRRMTISAILGTIVALFISLNIMTQNPILHVSTDTEERGLLWVILIVVGIFEIMTHLHFGSGLLRRLLDPKYETKEYYQRLYLSGHTEDSAYKEKFKKFPLRTRVLFLFLKYGWIVTLTASLITFSFFVKSQL